MAFITNFPIIDTDFDAFIRADGAAARQRDAYSGAVGQKKAKTARRLGALEEHPELGPDSDGAVFPSDDDEAEAFEEAEVSDSESMAGGDSPRRLVEPRRLGTLFSKRSLQFTYAATDGNALGERALRDVRDFEEKLRSLPSYRALCTDPKAQKNKRYQCNPGVSMSAFLWPSWSTNASAMEDDRFTVTYDALGPDMFPPSVIIDYFGRAGHSKDVRWLPRYFPKNYTWDAAGKLPSRPPAFMRSEFTFQFLVGDTAMPMTKIKAEIGAFRAKFTDMVVSEVYPLAALGSVREDYPHIRIYYKGSNLLGYEVMRELSLDALLALGSVVFVLLYLWFHTRAFLLSFANLVIIFYSIPMAYFLSSFFGINRMTIASFLSLFLITGVGSDVIFVFMDFWNQSARLFTGATVPQRLVYTITHGGSACSATTFVTSVSFLANLASVLQPLREFGFFMGMCVISCLLLVVMFLPPLLSLRESCPWRMRKSKAVAPGCWAGDIDMCSAAPEAAQKKERSDGRLKDAPMMAMLADLSPRPRGDDVPVMANLALEGPPAPLPPPSRSVSLEPQEREEADCSHHAEGAAKGPAKASLMQMMLGSMVSVIGKCPLGVLIMTILLVLVFMASLPGQLEMDTGMPKIFPDEHNQNAGEKAFAQFSTEARVTRARPETGLACAANRTTSEGCAYHWCDSAGASTQYGLEDGTTGSCWRRQATDGSDSGDSIGWGFRGCHTVSVKTRVASNGLAKDLLAARWPKAWRHIVEQTTTAGEIYVFEQTNRAVKELPTLVLEDWGLGQLDTVKFYDMADTGAFNFFWPETMPVCEVQTLCFLGSQTCDLPGWLLMGQIDLSDPDVNTSAPSRLLHDIPPPTTQVVSEEFLPQALEDAPSRLLAAAGEIAPFLPASLQKVAPNKRFSVTVVWGVIAFKESPLLGQPAEIWKFDRNFEPTNPWAQRAIYSMCTQHTLKLRVVSTNCWMIKFRTWVLAQKDQRFPTRDLNTLLMEWWDIKIDAALNIWLVNNKMKATQISFTADKHLYSSARSQLQFMTLWNDYVATMNAKASVTANNAYHTSVVWPRAEAEQAVKDSTIDTILISAGCGFFGMLLFTGDPVLALLVLGLVLGIIFGLAFFMVIVMGWKIGPIEVISLVVFVGYSITYSLHIAHNYSEIGWDNPELQDLLWTMKLRHEKEGDPDSKDAEGSSVDNGAKQPELTKGDAAKGKGGADDPSKVSAWEIRHARTRLAVLHLGGATLSSAVSTMGSSAFLLFCTLQIFVKLGAVVIAVTILSISFALIALSAVLMMLGPPLDPWYHRWRRQLFHKLFSSRAKELQGCPKSSCGRKDGKEEAEVAGIVLHSE